MAQFLFEVQQKNRLQQKGLLRRFSISCYGHQETVEEMRAEKAEKFKELKDHKKKQDKEYEEWFLRYRPADELAKKQSTPKIKSKTKKNAKTLTKREKLINKYKGKSSKTQKRGLFF
jgi:hypothetical protein